MYYTVASPADFTFTRIVGPEGFAAGVCSASGSVMTTCASREGGCEGSYEVVPGVLVGRFRGLQSN